MSFKKISLPLLFFQDASPKKDQSNIHPSQRNISSPYGLTIPLRSQPRQRVDTPTQYLALPTDKKGKAPVAYLETPKRAVILSEKQTPRRQEQYTLNGRSTFSTSLRYDSPNARKLIRGSAPGQKLNDSILAFMVTFALAVLLAIGIPIAAILPKRYIIPLPVNVMIPFFVDPGEDAWKRLEAAVIKYPDTSFGVIINPASGPGNSTWPAEPYIAALKSLNVYPNVHTLGYIDTFGGLLPHATVRTQITTYAGWKEVGPGMALRGIYFDRTPSSNDGDGLVRNYLQNLSETVRQTEGWSQAHGLVVCNPGRVPDPEVRLHAPDVMVVFEGTYADIPGREALHKELEEAEGQRGDWAMMVHSAPKDLGRGGLRRIVESVRRDVEWLYVTDLTKSVYQGYGADLEEWLDVTW